MRVVGSMTTLPIRLPYIRPVIQSILRQNRKLDVLYLNIPTRTLKGEEYEFNEEFFDGLDRLKIVRCKDIGPITKLLPVLDEEIDPDTRIITFDDDVIVNRQVVGILMERASAYPDCVLSFSGWRVGNLLPLLELVRSSDSDTEVDWVQGCHTIMYKRSMLDKQEIMQSFPDAPAALFKNDDHRISAYLATKNIPRIALKEDSRILFKPEAHSYISSISGNIMFNYQVFSIVLHFWQKGIYRKSCTITNSVVFWVVITMILLGIVLKHSFGNRPSEIRTRVSNSEFHM